MIRYFYIREDNNLSNPPSYEHDDDGNVYQVRRVTRGNPIACVASERRKDVDMGEGWDLITYAVSVANSSKGDEFNKAEGRQMAKDRLTNPNKKNTSMDAAYCFNVESDNDYNEVLEFIMEEISNNGVIPNRVRRAARRWLNWND